MSDLPESIKIKMLGDAGYHPIPIQESYLKLVEFVNKVANEDMGYSPIAQEATKLLQSIGEEQ